MSKEGMGSGDQRGRGLSFDRLEAHNVKFSKFNNLFSLFWYE